MCRRVFVKTGAAELMAGFAFADVGDAGALHKAGPRWNGAPGQDYPIIVREPDMPGAIFVHARWGLIPSWIGEANPKLRPINATAERVTTAPMFRGAYRSRRALMPISGFFEWRAIKGAKAKQPYAIAMQDGRPFALAAIWERWRHPETELELKTFAIVTCPANALVRQIHDRKPVILAEADYAHWLSEEPDPKDLLRAYPAELMIMWPISTRVNSPRNDDPSILDPEREPGPDLFDR